VNAPENQWTRWNVGVILPAILLQLVVDAIRPYVPYILAVLTIAALVALVRWWRDRW
jgi:hypothetical protein